MNEQHVAPIQSRLQESGTTLLVSGDSIPLQSTAPATTGSEALYPAEQVGAPLEHETVDIENIGRTLMAVRQRAREGDFDA